MIYDVVGLLLQQNDLVCPSSTFAIFSYYAMAQRNIIAARVGFAI